MSFIKDKLSTLIVLYMSFRFDILVLEACAGSYRTSGLGKNEISSFNN